jgi:endonuclease/exonuclease/phosphatase family metal-dependent hydrolase
VLDLEHKPSSKNIVFIGTHLKAKKAFETTRTGQTQSIVRYIRDEYPTHTHIILAGDFNGDKKEPFYSEIFNFGFRSAYRTMMEDKEPPYTTWKFKGRDGTERESCQTIDYIFYNPIGFTPKTVLKFPSKTDMGHDGLPSRNYPSDHLALEVIFNIQ